MCTSIDMDPAHSVRPVRAGTNTSSAALLARTYVPADGLYSTRIDGRKKRGRGESASTSSRILYPTQEHCFRLVVSLRFPINPTPCFPLVLARLSLLSSPNAILSFTRADGRVQAQYQCTMPTPSPAPDQVPVSLTQKKGTRLSLFSLTRPALLSSHRARRGAGRRVGVARPGRSPADRRGEAGGSECFALV
jgi:hypothetical protein